MSTVNVDPNTVDVVFNDELGGGPVATRYEDGAPWPSWTVSDNMEAHLLTDDREYAFCTTFLSVDPPEDYDFPQRAAGVHRYRPSDALG